jgi:hypothetical protein
MDENLVGYLLEALEPEDMQAVEAGLEAQPELRARLDLLERALAPLAADADEPAPPPTLVLSTIARVAEQQCHKLPPAPPPPQQVGVPSRRWARRPDMLVAAVLLIALGGMGASALVHVWRDYHGRTACAENLRLLWGGLQQYCTANNGNFPRVSENKGPRGVAGIFVPILHDSQMLPTQASLTCPAEGAPSLPGLSGDERVAPRIRSVRDLEKMYLDQPEQFVLEARKLSGSYAYTLGYREGGHYHGLRCDSGDHLPILADRLEKLSDINSRNHGGTGQNVLYLGGWVHWCTQRTVGVDRDDIYVNRRYEPHAGLDRDDTVLGSSDARAGQD